MYDDSTRSKVMSDKPKAFFHKLVEVLFFIGMGVFLFWFADALLTAFIEG